MKIKKGSKRSRDKKAPTANVAKKARDEVIIIAACFIW